jgi:hypothetical protein
MGEVGVRGGGNEERKSVRKNLKNKKKGEVWTEFFPLVMDS